MKILFRHGQCEHNIVNWISCGLDSKSELTDLGIEVVTESAHEVRKKIIQHSMKNMSGYNFTSFKFMEAPSKARVYASPLLRTKQTAEIICDVLDIDKNSIVYDERLKEAQYGSYDEGPVANLPHDVYDMDKFVEQGSESYADIDKRLKEFMDEIFNNTDDFIIVSHALPIR
jgi:broad specificity phosphatase PhoE